MTPEDAGLDVAAETRTERVVRLALALGRANRIIAQVHALAALERPVGPEELRRALRWPRPDDQHPAAGDPDA